MKIQSSTRNVTARVGSTAILECLVDGYSGEVEWKRENNGKRKVPAPSKMGDQGCV